MTTEKRPITPEDLNRIVTLEDPQLSPDGQWVAFVHVTTNPMDKGYTRNIWLAATDGSRVFQFTRGGKDASPRWSPDGTRLAFVSGRGGKPQIFVISTAAPGGEPRALTSNSNGATSPAWSPDGAHIAYLSGLNAAELLKEDSGETEAKPADSLEAKHRKERQEEDEKNRFDPRTMTRIPYRQGTSFMDDRNPQVYVIPTADGLEGDAAKPRRLTGIDAGYTAAEWSPDGQTIYTIRPKRLGTDEFWREQNIFKLNVADGTETQMVDETHFIGSVLPSPDGKWLACERIIHNTTDTIGRLSLIPLQGGETVDLNLRLNRDVAYYRWTAENSLVVAVATEGDFHIYELHPGSETAEPIEMGTRMMQGMSLSSYGSIAYAASTPLNPGELYFKKNEQSDAVQLTKFNQKFLDEVIVQETHELIFQSPGGTSIQGWYVLPVGYEPGKKYPLALNIHGGPHVMWGAGMQSMWHEWQTHAARGYVVFYCNPRGSGGYGEAFMKALHAAWGTVAMDDIMAGVDAMIEKGCIDTDRMAITGGSYGGYMTAWIISHSDRFKSAVSVRGVYNLISFYGTSDVPLLIDHEFDEQPWTNPQLLWDNSPVAYAHKIKTPLLILHSENDFRVPIEQGEQLFAFVRRSGNTPVKMIRFPREGHELTRTGEPAHRQSHLTEQLAWFDQYCMPEKKGE